MFKKKSLRGYILIYVAEIQVVKMVKIYPIISRRIGAGLNNIVSDFGKFTDSSDIPPLKLDFQNQHTIPKPDFPEESVWQEILSKTPSDTFEKLEPVNYPKLNMEDSFENDRFNLIEEWGDVLFMLGFAAISGGSALSKHVKAKEQLEKGQLKISA